MKTLGVTGNIGSGKSYICSLLMKHGMPYYNCDNRSKYIVNNDENVQREIVAIFGTKSYIDGIFNRDHIAKNIMLDNSLLNRVENILKKPMLEDLNMFKSQYVNKEFICLESAILLESDFRAEVDDILLVTSTMENKIKRIKQRDPFRTDEEIDFLFKNQLNEEDMKKVCKYIIKNDDRNENELNIEIKKILIDFKN